MNVLFYYNLTMNPVHGGIAQVSLRLGEYLRKKGNIIYYLSKSKTSDSLSNWQFYLSGSSVQENEVYFENFIRFHKIQIVVNQNGISPRSNEAVVWAHKIGVPVVTVIHNSLFGMYGITNHFGRLRLVLRNLGLFDCVQFMLFKFFKCKYGRYYKQQVKLSTRVVLLSDKFIPEYCYFSGIQRSMAASKIMAIPNPIELPVTMNNFNEKYKEVLYVGRLSPEKQVDLLLDIWARVQPNFTEWRLIIVGDGMEREFLKEKVSKLHIEHVYFEGFRRPDDYYRRASLFCMTSAYEGFGMVLTEAMSYGTVPLAFNSFANVSDIIDDGKNGLLVTPFSIDEYVEKLSELMRDSNIRREMSERAIEKSKMFSLERICQYWSNLFHSEVI